MNAPWLTVRLELLRAQPAVTPTQQELLTLADLPRRTKQQERRLLELLHLQQLLDRAD